MHALRFRRAKGERYESLGVELVRALGDGAEIVESAPLAKLGGTALVLRAEGATLFKVILDDEDGDAFYFELDAAHGRASFSPYAQADGASLARKLLAFFH
jgi:hypothetical protein